MRRDGLRFQPYKNYNESGSTYHWSLVGIDDAETKPTSNVSFMDIIVIMNDFPDHEIHLEPLHINKE